MSDSDPENSTNMIYEYTSIQDNTTEQESTDAYGFNQTRRNNCLCQCDYRNYQLCVPSHFLIQNWHVPFQCESVLRY